MIDAGKAMDGSGASIGIPASPEAPAAARAFLRDQLAERLDSERLRQLELIVTELVSNAVRYGSHADDTITVAHGYRGRSLFVSVTDSCRSRTSPVLLATSGERESGRGLPIVDRLAAEWGDEIVRGRRRVWAAVN